MILILSRLYFNLSSFITSFTLLLLLLLLNAFFRSSAASLIIIEIRNSN